MPLEILVRREGPKLGAADQISADIITGMKEKEIVTASIRRPRNPRHHALLFALLQLVFEHQQTYATIEQLLGALKLSIGLFDTELTLDGLPYVVARSISFASMDQTSFAIVYDKMLDVILTKIIPNTNRRDLELRVHDILDGYSK